MRVTKRKKRGRHSARYLVRCNCSYDGFSLCGKQLEIYVGDDKDDDFFEIAGVMDTRERWLKLFREIGLLPDTTPV